MQKHHYATTIIWTGNLGEGTANYRAYSRDHQIEIEGKPTILASSDPSFRGDSGRHNPEELFVASISGCHMLWFLHLCTTQKITVTAYEDQAEGIMEESEDGSGRFTKVTLNPIVTISGSYDNELLNRIHAEAHRKCFIANSCNFPILHKARVVQQA